MLHYKVQNKLVYKVRKVFNKYMKPITTNQLQDQLSKVIREVEAGEIYEVKRYSKSVAVLISKEEFEKLTSKVECKKCMEDLRNIAKKLNS